MVKEKGGAHTIKSARQIGAAVSADYLIGLGTVGDRMLIQLDFEGLLPSNGLGPIHNLAA